MPTLTTYPGVYVEEVPSQVRTIAGVSTSVGAFVGYFRRGPLNAPLRILSMGDFEREFGGLHRYSEASYAVSQFFLNGGTEAWVVRVATAGTFETASVVVENTDGEEIFRARAGRRIRGRSEVNPGSWGNALRLEVDYDTTAPDELFNLAVSEVSSQDGRLVVLQATPVGDQADSLRGLTIRDNTMNASQSPFGTRDEPLPDLYGVLARVTEEASIHGNRIAGFVSGIVLSQADKGDMEPASRFSIRDNQIEGAYNRQIPSAGIWADAVGAAVSRNWMTGTSIAIALSNSYSAMIADNRIDGAKVTGVFLVGGERNRLIGNQISDSRFGVLAWREARLEVMDCTFEGLASGGFLGWQMALAVFLSRNRFFSCGFDDTVELPGMAGIAVFGTGQPGQPEVTVDDCKLIKTGISVDDSVAAGKPTCGIWIAGATSCRVRNNVLRVPSSESRHVHDRALWLAGRNTGSALITGNHFAGPYWGHLAEIGSHSEEGVQSFAGALPGEAAATAGGERAGGPPLRPGDRPLPGGDLASGSGGRRRGIPAAEDEAGRFEELTDRTGRRAGPPTSGR